MAGVGEMEGAVGGEVGAGVLVKLCGLGEGEKDVEGGEGFGRFLQGGEVVADLFAEVDEEVVFEGFGALVRAEDFLLHLLEGGGDVALGVGHGLLALVVVGDFVDFGFGDFEEVAEDVVELDFEGVDAGAFALGFLQFGEPVFSFARGGAEVVEFGGVAVADEVSVFGGSGWFVAKGVGEEFGEGGEFLDFGLKRVELVGGWFVERAGSSLHSIKVFAVGGDAFEGGLQGFEVAGVAAALGEPAGGALDVANVFEGFAQFGEEVGFGEELFDGVEAGVEGVEVTQGMEEPVAEFARAHGGGGAVEGGEEGVLGAGARLHEVEVELGGGVDKDVGAVVAHAEGGEVFAVATELMGEVVEGGTSGADGGGHLGAAKAVQGFDLEVVLQGVERGFVEEGVGVVGEGAGELAEGL